MASPKLFFHQKMMVSHFFHSKQIKKQNIKFTFFCCIIYNKCEKIRRTLKKTKKLFFEAYPGLGENKFKGVDLLYKQEMIRLCCLFYRQITVKACDYPEPSRDAITIFHMDPMQILEDDREGL